MTTRLLKDLEYVANLDEGINNVTQAFFWPYAFLGSRAEIEYIVATNSSALVVGKRSALHVSDRCFGLFYTSFAMPHQSVYAESFNNIILLMQQAGLMTKFTDEVAGKMHQQGSGRLLDSSSSKSLAQTTVDERGLTLADTEGMFLLLGVGFLVSGGVLISEWVGGCSKKCRSILSKRRDDQQRAQEEEDAAIAAEFKATQKPRRKSSTMFPKGGKPPEDIPEGEGTESPKGPVAEEVDVRSRASAQSSESRKTSVSLNFFTRQTLKDMSEGHKRRHSNIIMMDGGFTTEGEALSNVSQRYERLETESRSGGSSINNSQILEVEINQEQRGGNASP